jgi:two-component system CheB/CheR fusion protein
MNPNASSTSAGPAALHESEARLRAVFETAVEAIVMIDERGCIDAVNPAAEIMFGWKSGELIGRNVSTLMPEPYHGQHDGYLANYLSTGKRRIIGIGREAFGQRRDGTIFPIDLSVGEFAANGRRLFTGIIRDITERRRLQAEVLRIGEAEQQRIGRDLHDDLCQQLAGIQFLAQTLATKLAEAGRPETAGAGEIARLIRHATEYTRDLSHGMSPVGLESDGLMSALEELALRTHRHFQISVVFRCPTPVLVSDPEIATHLYRIAQESISNAIRHGKARNIEIGLAAVGQQVRLAVRDDGKGLPTGKPKKKGTGLGLSIMQYRAGMLGGSLVIANEPDGGVTVACSVHLMPRNAASPAPKPNETSKPKVLRRPPHSAGR